MAIGVSESFEGSYGTQGASRVFYVSGTPDKAVALAAPGIPRRGNFYPGKAFVCDSVVAQESNGPEYFRVTATYVTPGSGLTGIIDAPEFEPPSFQVDPFEIAVRSQVDLDGRLVQNTAGDLFEGGAELLALGIRFDYTVYYRSLDLTRALAYKNAVNDKPMTLLGILWPTEHLLCEHIGSPQIIRGDEQYIRVVHRFAGIEAGSPLGKYPWQAGYLNAGRNGWYQDSTDNKPKKAGLTSKDDVGEYQPVGWDVLLDNVGKPQQQELESAGVVVGGGGVVPRSNPNNLTVGTHFYKAVPIPNDKAGETNEAMASNIPFRLYFKTRKVVELERMFTGAA